MIYIKEAHPTDGWRMGKNDREGIDIKTHVTYDDRVSACTLAQSKLKIEMPALIDSMDDKANRAYAGWPDRAYLIDKNGVIEVAGGRGPRGFKPSISGIKTWLKANVADAK